MSKSRKHKGNVFSDALETLGLETLQAWTEDTIHTIKKSEAYNNVTDLFDELKSNRQSQSAALLAASTALGMALGPLALIVTIPVRLAHQVTDQDNQDLFNNLLSCKDIPDKNKRMVAVEKCVYRYLDAKFPNLDLKDFHVKIEKKLKDKVHHHSQDNPAYSSKPVVQTHRRAPPIPETKSVPPAVPAVPAVPARGVGQKVAFFEGKATQSPPENDKKSTAPPNKKPF